MLMQEPGHSLTIVGLERQKDGQVHLLVFDPSYRDSSTVTGFIGMEFRLKPAAADDILKPYRRGPRYLHKYNEFEVL